jgi:hypothetical protein
MDTLSNPESMLTRLRPAPNDTLVGEEEEVGEPSTFFSDAVGWEWTLQTN